MASLDERLAAADVAPGTDAMTAWRAMRSAEGAHTTILDLYELAARETHRTARDLDGAERLALARRALPEIWPGFELTPSGERHDGPITIADYDPQWPARYAQWRNRILQVIDVVRIEHVGSTSVPGLPAKPIIDIQVSVDNLEDEARYVSALERLGLELRSRDEWHRYFRPAPNRPRKVHVHVCASGSAWERDHLLFRDYLRTHPGARDAYAAAKQEAARVWGDDRIAYTEAKTEVILQIMERARRTESD